MNEKERLNKLVEDGCRFVVHKRMGNVFPNGKEMDAIRAEVFQDKQTILGLIDRQPSDGDVLVEGNALHILSVTAEKYHELIMAVDSKYQGESRHDTALRYIRERELEGR